MRLKNGANLLIIFLFIISLTISKLGLIKTVDASGPLSFNKWTEDFETGTDGWEYWDGEIIHFDVQDSIVYEGDNSLKMTGRWDGNGGYAGCYIHEVSLAVNPDTEFEFAYYFPSKNTSYVGYRVIFDNYQSGYYYSLFWGNFINTSTTYKYQFENEGINKWHFHSVNIYNNYESAFGNVPQDLHITSIRVLMGDPYHSGKIQTCYFDDIKINNITYETLLVSDDFENFVVGDYPDENGWMNMYDGVTAYVSSDNAYSGSKSLRLEAYPNWARADYISLSFPEHFSYEVAVYVEDTSRGAVIGFAVAKSPYLYNFNSVLFGNDGNIRFIGVNQEVNLIQQYQSKTWYRIRVDMDYEACTADVYVNDVLKGTDYDIWPKEFYYSRYGDVTLNYFTLWMNNFEGSGTSIGYFDEIKLYEIEKPLSVPSAPKSLQAEVDNDDIILKWDPPVYWGISDITNYYIYRGIGPGSLNLIDTITNVTTYTDNNVAEGGTYYYQVSAVNGEGEGTGSVMINITFTTDYYLDKDTDGDGIPDLEDTDDDDDDYLDYIEILLGTDPLDSNSTPLDSDADGTPDYFDGDDDNDGYTDVEENAMGTDPLDGTDYPKKVEPEDTDGDGVPDSKDDDDDNDGYTDFQERIEKTNPLDPNDFPEGVEKTDTDGDGIFDSEDTDDDDDGMTDYWELLYGFNSLFSDCDDDFDGDGYTNLEEFEAGSNPRDKHDYPDVISKLPIFHIIVAIFAIVGAVLGVIYGMIAIIKWIRG